MTVEHVTVEQVIRLQAKLVADEGQAGAPVVAREKLEGAIARPSSHAFGAEFFPTLAEKAAVLLQGIVIAHPFLDGNKRAGLAAMLFFFRKNGVHQTPDLETLYDFVIEVTTGELREVPDIVARVRELFALE